MTLREWDVADAEADVQTAQTHLDNVADDFVTKDPLTWLPLMSEFDGNLSIRINADAAFQVPVQNGNISESRMASVPMQIILGQADNIRHFITRVGFDANNPATYHEIVVRAEQTRETLGAAQVDPLPQGQDWRYGEGVRTCCFQLWSEVDEAGQDGDGYHYVMQPPVGNLVALDVLETCGENTLDALPVIVMALDAPDHHLAKYEAWEQMSFVGNLGFAKVCDYNAGAQERPLRDALDPPEHIVDQVTGALTTNYFPDIKVIPPQLLRDHSNQLHSNNLGFPERDDVLYLVDCSINFSKNRQIVLLSTTCSCLPRAPETSPASPCLTPTTAARSSGWGTTFGPCTWGLGSKTFAS